MELKDKIVVITGGSKGLGKAMALRFLKDGAKVIVCSRDESEFVNLENGILGIKADVTKENELQNLAEKVVAQFGKLDIWINNAGVGMEHSLIEEIDSVLAHEVMEVNFFGTFFGSRSVIKYMKKQKFGTIVNIISSRAFDPSPLSAVYSSSKWAVRGFTELLRKALSTENISVIAIYPAGMQTDFFGKIKPVDYKNYMEPEFVAGKIVENLKKEIPEEELIIQN
jgi:NAD(P)-dependent dehydrogenase (short-subunit alcohol dehydrogenase family)